MSEKRKCSVETCERDAMSQRTLCVGHRERKRRFGDVQADVPLRHPHGKIDSEVCAVQGCSRPRAPKNDGTHSSLCVAHFARKARSGDVQADKPVRALHSGRLDVWCDYRTAHNRVKNVRGKATDHACVDCGSPAVEWSYRGGARYEFSGPHARGSGTRQWSGDPADYDPRCNACHRKHDQ